MRKETATSHIGNQRQLVSAINGYQCEKSIGLAVPKWLKSRRASAKRAISKYFAWASMIPLTSAGTKNLSRTRAGKPPATIPDAEPNGRPFASRPSFAELAIARMLPLNAARCRRCCAATERRCVRRKPCKCVKVSGISLARLVVPLVFQ
jgi:hypothetical protein